VIQGAVNPGPSTVTCIRKRETETQRIEQRKAGKPLGLVRQGARRRSYFIRSEQTEIQLRRPGSKLRFSYAAAGAS